MWEANADAIPTHTHTHTHTQLRHRHTLLRSVRTTHLTPVDTTGLNSSMDNPSLPANLLMKMDGSRNYEGEGKMG